MSFARVLVSAVAAASVFVASATGTVPFRGSLFAVVGPGATINIHNPTRTVTKLKAGSYALTVIYKSKVYDFHLRGPGINKVFKVGTTGITLRPGTYFYSSDRGPASMAGNLIVVG